MKVNLSLQEERSRETSQYIKSRSHLLLFDFTFKRE